MTLFEPAMLIAKNRFQMDELRIENLRIGLQGILRDKRRSWIRFIGAQNDVLRYSPLPLTFHDNCVILLNDQNLSVSRIFCSADKGRTAV
jgi:hypothetical protein